jgi:N-acetylglucosamine-6-sulfatase
MVNEISSIGPKDVVAKHRLFGAAVVAVVFALGLILLALRAEPASAAPKPNVVVIQTDDQPVEQFHRRWRDYLDRKRQIMPNTMRLLRDQGVEFSRYITPYPICAPSRASLLSGNYAHNHRVLRVGGETGGWTAFRNNAILRENLPVWLQRAGYRTLHFGKFMNFYGGLDEPAEAEVPPGWDRWVSDATDNSTRQFYGYTQNIDGKVTGPLGSLLYTPWDEKDPVGCPWFGFSECDYHSDAMSLKAARSIRNSGGRPFYLQIDYHTPHGDKTQPIGPEPAVRHYRSALRTATPKPAGFNETDVSDKPAVISEIPPMDQREIRRIKNEHQRSIEALRSVDDGVKWIYEALEATGKLDNTYIIFTSDNGFFLGQHRVSRGKLLPYEPALRVPMVVRGPGIEPGSQSDELVANQDVAPTILKLARARAARRVDGRSMVRFWNRPDRISRRPVLISSYSSSVPLAESDYPGEPLTVTGGGAEGSGAGASGLVTSADYVGIRLGPYKYVELESGERELYVLTRDPAELENRYSDPRYRRIVGFLEKELDRLRGCRAADCRTPTSKWPKPPD